MSPISNLNEGALRDLSALPIGTWEAADLLLARESLGITQNELAAAIGYDRSALAKIEGGDVKPRRVVELAVRYLIERRPQGARLEIKDRENPRFCSVNSSIGINELGFPGSTNSEVRLADGPAIWLRLLPEFDAGNRWAPAELKKAATQNGFPLVQLIEGYSDLGFVRGPNGFGVFGMMGDRSIVPAVSFIFETGEIWSIDTYIIDAVKRYAEGGARPAIPYLEDRFKFAIHSFRILLTRLGLGPQFRWIAGLEGVENYGLYYPPQPGRQFLTGASHGPSLIDKVCAMGSMDEMDSPASALKPFFKKLFSAFNVDRPDYLDDLSNPK